MGHTTGMIDLEALDAQLITRSAGDEYPVDAGSAPSGATRLGTRQLSALGRAVTVLSRYLAAASQSTATEPEPASTSSRPPTAPYAGLVITAGWPR